MFASEPIEAFATSTRPIDDLRFTRVDDAVSVTLRFPNERIAQFYCSFGAADVDMYRVVGTEGEFTLEPAFRFETPTRLLVSTSKGQEIHTFDHCDQFGGLVSYFSDCIANGSPPEADGEEGLADIRALLALEKARQTRAHQKISSPPRPRHPTADMVRAVPLTTRRILL